MWERLLRKPTLIISLRTHDKVALAVSSRKAWEERAQYSAALEEHQLTFNLVRRKRKKEYSLDDVQQRRRFTALMISTGARCLATRSSFRNLIRDPEHGVSITSESYYSAGLSRGLLLGSRSLIPQQNGAVIRFEEGEEKEVRDGRRKGYFTSHRCGLVDRHVWKMLCKTPITLLRKRHRREAPQFAISR
ncbi:hypothetical protein PUN28_012011 [Cardiocondyla obscurior]|uniref:Uncharacterized protein n=1 Tax=Cardiocondyla obscurior TaxID=286306 RepID=A0AAW2FEK0_9HYME